MGSDAASKRTRQRGAARGPRSVVAGLGALAGIAAAAPMAWWLWGFSVDDAWIPARYAHHLAAGVGYRFDPAGPITDGVTPLGFAHLLSPFAHAGAMDAFEAARWIGVVAWLVAAGALGAAVARLEGGPGRWLGLAVIAASAPLGAWSGAGLETGVVIALVTLAAVSGAGGWARACALCVGGAAAWRPELAPLAVTLALAPLGAPRGRGGGGGMVSAGWRARAAGLAVQLALAVGPFALVAVTRLVAFGRFAPLSALAKTPDVALGARYAFACALLAGPIALAAPRALRARAEDATTGMPVPAAREVVLARWLALATLVHLAAVSLAGGDWMPLSRLVAPVVPLVALGASALASRATTGWSLAGHGARVAVAVAGQLWVALTVGERARDVVATRLALVEAARPALADAKVIVALDVGWVGVAAPHARIVDLAGVTDPRIAALPGGHTTKRVPDTLLAERDADAIVLLAAPDHLLFEPWTNTRFDRGVERWIASGPDVARRYPLLMVTPAPLRYVIARRATEEQAAR